MMNKYLRTIKNLLLVSIFAIGCTGFSQQDPQYTQYMYNMSLVNPAYATDDLGVINFGGFHRSQWVGAVGGPTTFSAFAHVPFNTKVELGLSFVADDIGDGALRENNIYGDFAYKLQLNNTGHHLSLGLKAGVTLFDTNFEGFQLESGGAGTDVAFGPGESRTFPNIGVGAFYYTDTYYVGLSTPNVLSTKHLESSDGIERLGSEEIHIFLTGGYVYQLNETVLLKPSVLLRGVANAPFMVDVSMNALLYDRFELGLSYRIDDAVSAMVNFKITPELRVGYAYDYTVTNFGNYNSGSHEIFLLYDLDLMKLNKGFNKSPRFF